MRIEAPHFVAAVEYAHGRVTETAPILRWMRGKTLHYVQTYCRGKRWTYRVYVDP